MTSDEVKAIRDAHYPMGKLMSRMEGLPSKMQAPDEALREICEALERARHLILNAVNACSYDSEESAKAGIYGLPSDVLIPMSQWLGDYGLPDEEPPQ